MAMGDCRNRIWTAASEIEKAEKTRKPTKRLKMRQQYCCCRLYYAGYIKCSYI